MTDWWWAYLALGAFVGFFSGLLGLGGGSAMVPVMVFIFSAKAFAHEHVVHLAIGTGMATILFTSASSVLSHHRRRAVDWNILRNLVPGVMTGTFLGALIAGQINVLALSVAFTAFVYYLATQMLVGASPEASRRLPGAPGMWLAGGGIGMLSSFAAIAGASLTVPFLVRRNVDVHRAIGTAAAVGWPLAAAGTAGYVFTGWGRPGLPEHSVGFVYLPAMFWITLASVAMAPVGARVAHRTPAARLKKVLALVLYALATGMLLSLL
jgi:uncharacterized membrane protein YfcA